MAATKSPKRPDQIGGGKPGPGRPKGTSKQADRDQIAATLKRLKLDPIKGMALLAQGPIECNVCDDGLVEKWTAGKEGPVREQRPCDVCKGTGQIAASPTQRADLMKELAQYVGSKRKATEHTGQDGGPIDLRISWLKSKK